RSAGLAARRLRALDERARLEPGRAQPQRSHAGSAARERAQGDASRREEAEMNAVLDPAGPQAAHIADLWWLTLALCVVVFVMVLAALAWAFWRAPRADAATPPEALPAPEAQKRVGRAVAAAVGVAGILLVGRLA